MDRDFTLEYYQAELKDREAEFKVVSDQLRTENNPLTRKTYERKIVDIGRQMDDLQQKIRERKADLVHQADQVAIRSLISLLNSYDDELDNIIRVYQRTLAHWSVSVNAKAATVEDIITELGRIYPRSNYTAQDEFLAHLVKSTSEPALAMALNRWGQQYRKSMNWLKLHEQIETRQMLRLKNDQPAILIKITRSDEISTQTKGDALYYQLTAWLIEDVVTYKASKRGVHSLVANESPDAQPCELKVLLQKITGLLNKFLEENNRLCEHCTNYPEVHVFLPLELISLDVDKWHLTPPSDRRPAACIGQDHVVVLRCAARYERNYTQRPLWLRYWQRHQEVLDRPVAEVFIPGDDEDLNRLAEVLDNATGPDRQTVGLQVTRVPIDVKELCYELLESGLPLAVWQRQELEDFPSGNDWSTVLPDCSLDQLPIQAKNERHSARRQSVNAHYGHHLSLVWDDPHLIPPDFFFS